MFRYIKIYIINAFYKNADGEDKDFSFIMYGDDEKLLNELQSFYEKNKGEKNILGYHVDIYEGEYPISNENELVYYAANEINENYYKDVYTNLETLLDKIKYEYNDFTSTSMKYVSMTFNEDGSIEFGEDDLLEFILFEKPLVDEIYYVNENGMIEKREEEIVRILK